MELLYVIPYNIVLWIFLSIWSSVDVGLAQSSLSNHSLVGFPLYTILPFTVPSLFSEMNISASIALRLSIGDNFFTEIR